MLDRIKRVMAVHDLSGFGRCSLTVALPILSACGVTCACLPTAVLSTHTGGFQGYTFRDLTDDLAPTAAHWKREGITFDALYTGYMSSEKQLEIVRGILDELSGEHTLTVVDPVLGDDGRLYSGLGEKMVGKMRALCAKADVIVPNMTEAALLLDRPFHGGEMDEHEILALCRALYELGARNVVLTGVMPSAGKIGAACYDGTDFSLCLTERVPASYDGTGDVFCSVLTGGLLRGLSLRAAAGVAAAFTRECIARTYARGGNRHFGVDFEEILYTLNGRLEAAQ